MDEIENLLLDGEKVLWSGKPDWTKVEPIKTGWRAKAGTIKFLIAASLIFMSLMGAGAIFNPSGFTSVVLGAIIFFNVITIFIALMMVFQSEQPFPDHPDHVYAITDRRLIVFERSKISTNSFTTNSFCGVHNRPNGDVRDLELSYGYDNSLILYALPDADQVEKIILERFTTMKASS